MRESRPGSGLERLFVYWLIFAVTVPIAPLGFAAEQKIDLDAPEARVFECTGDADLRPFYERLG